MITLFKECNILKEYFESRKYFSECGTSESSLIGYFASRIAIGITNIIAINKHIWREKFPKGIYLYFCDHLFLTKV